MVQRPNADNLVFTGGYQFNWGYGDNDLRPCSGKTILDVQEKSLLEESAPLAQEMVQSVVNTDVFSPGSPDGKVPLSDDLGNWVSWINLDYNRNFYKEVRRKLGKRFRGTVLPLGVESLYITFFYYYDYDKGSPNHGQYLTLSIPIIGKRTAIWGAVRPTGEVV